MMPEMHVTPKTTEQLLAELAALHERLQASEIERERAVATLNLRTQQLVAMRDVNLEMSQGLDLPTLLNRIVHRAVKLVSNAESGAVHLWDAADQVLTTPTWHGIGGWIGNLRIGLGEGFVGVVAQHRESLRVSDYQHSSYVNPCIARYNESLALIGEPMLYRDQLIGVITLGRRQAGYAFTVEDHQLLTLIANQAAIAIENARLSERVQRQKPRFARIHMALRQEIVKRQQTEATLRESEENLRSLLTNVPGVITTVEHDGTILSINRTRSGIYPEDVIGKTFYDFTPPEYHDTIRKHLDVVFRTGEPTNFEVRGLETPDASWYRCRAAALKHDGKIKTAVIISTNITRHKRSEEALKASEANYRLLAENSIQGISVLNKDFRLEFVNKAFAKIFGYDRPEVLLGPSRPSLSAPHERSRLLGYFTARMRGEPAPERYEFQGRRQDGTEIWLECMASRVQWNGELAILGTYIDITERKCAEKALQRSEECYRSLVEGSLQGISISRHGVHLFANAALAIMLGHQKPEDLFGRSIWEHVDPQEYDRLHGYFEARLKGDVAPARYTYRAHKTDGEPLWIERLISPITWEGETAYLGTYFDVTKRKQAEKALRESEQWRLALEKLASTAQMAAGVAHEINNPLAGIKNAFLLIKDAIPPDHPYYGYVALIEHEIDRISRIVRQMYQLYQPASQIAEHVDLRATVQDVCQMLRSSSLKRGVTIREQLPADLPLVHLSRGNMIQVLFNVLQNAIQVSPTQAEVAIQAEPPGDMIRLTVTDCGEGIPPEVLPHIFEPFFTTKQDRFKEVMGLGLAISNSLMTAMGGRIEVKTEVGQGTTFTLVLPRSGPAAMP